jgi:hypothetical protein
MRVPKLRLLQLWGHVILYANFQLRWGLKKSCSPHQDFSNNMSHATFKQGNWVDSWFLMVESQILNLTLGLSFGHNSCFKRPNGSCKPILDIYVSIYFQWYKELFNPIGFYLCDRYLKIQKSIRTPTPKMGVHLGVWGFIPSHSFALLGAWNVTLGLPFWLATLQTSLGHEPKPKITTLCKVYKKIFWGNKTKESTYFEGKKVALFR